MIADAQQTLPGPGRFRPRRFRVGVRDIRLATGCVLFAYVLAHLVNHATGNVSLQAMEAVLDVVAPAVGLPGVSQALYGSLAVHAALGFFALYARPRLDLRPGEWMQLGLGLAVVPLLAGHVVSTRLAYTLHGTVQGYAQVLYGHWVVRPEDAVLQSAALLAAWIHGCVGLHFWLRLKPFYGRVAPLLLCGAVLVPVLALLGYAQAGRAVMRLALDESWRIENAPGTSQGHALALAMAKERILIGFAALLALTLAARLVRTGLRRRGGLIQLTYPGGARVRVPRGASVLEASRIHRIPHASVCGGRGRCSTCRIRVTGEGAAGLVPAGSDERAVLDRVGAGEGVRLACQLRPGSDLSVTPLLSPRTGPGDLARFRGAAAFGEERFVAAMFIDMRGSSLLAERRLPFDTVFVINRFLDAVGHGVVEAGGAPNQFLGDGMMALFGTTVPPPEAARQALEAIRLVGLHVEALNVFLAGSLEQPIRFGIGLHAGTAILGDMGQTGGGRTVFTAIGDPVNVAARLEGMTKRLGVEAIVSDAVLEVAGLTSGLPGQEVPIDGRSGRIWVRPIPRASEALFGGPPGRPTG